MDDGKLIELSAWITKAGLAGRPEIDMLDGYCERLRAAGLALAGGTVVIDTLHPLYEGHAIRWFRDQPETKRTEYGRTNRGEASESYRRSIYYRLLMGSETHLRCRLTPESIAEYSNLEASFAAGNTDYLGIMNKFAAEGTVGDMDCVYSGWETGRPEGFTEAEVLALRRLSPFLAMAMKCASLGRTAQALVETYLGREAGRQVLSGRIERGIADRIEAVLWFSDLRGFTRITDNAQPAHIIPLLNDYAEAVVSAIQAEGGDVLKLIGDGVLAMFPAEERGKACAAAIAAATGARERVAALNERRSAESLPVTEIYLGLHIGEVFFGNVGSPNRLDFTVVGPAVNEASRIAAMCRSVDQPLLLSAAFAAALGNAGPPLASVGRYALRGLRHSQELFTLDRGGV
ncbi:MAG TPA: adenylate/guanylate cyclase domain-containing protein [Dongiaceae bacterium]|jgi:adenylate cyclase